MLDSPHNPRVKLFRSLAEAKHRRKTGLFVLEGKRLIGEALRARAEIVWAAYCPETFVGVEEDRLLRGLLDAGVEILEISPRALAAMSHTETPPGIAAVARIPEPPGDLAYVFQGRSAAGMGRDGPSEKAAAAPPEPPQQPAPGGTEVPPRRAKAWALGLWELRDPGNMGTVIRTAHAFGAAAVVAVGGCVDFCDPKVVRASAGSLLHLPLLRLPNLYALREALAAAKAALVVAYPAAPLACDEADYPPRSLLLVGSEAHGLPEEVLAAADLRVSIPMPGGAESLNAGVAAGILAFHLSRPRRGED